MISQVLLRQLRRAAAFVVTFSVGCGSDPTVSVDGTTGVVKVNCLEGADLCDCTPAGTCGGGLACNAGTCEHSPLPAPGPAPAELPPPSGGSCVTDSDCSNVEVCRDSTCTHAWRLHWFIRNASVEPLGCEPPYTMRSGELAVGYFESGDLYNSIRIPQELPTTTGCPFVWEDPMFQIEAFIGEFARAQFVLQLFVEPDIDAPPIRMARWCWDSLHTGECGPIPAEFLVAGQLDVPDLHLEFSRSIE